MLLEKPTKKAGRGFLVLSFLHQDIQDLPILIDRSKQIMLLSVDPNKDFINKPLISRLDLIVFVACSHGPGRIERTSGGPFPTAP